MVTAVVAVALTVATPAAPAHAEGAGDYIGRINALRASRGLPGLAVDGNMMGLAQQHSQEMAGAMQLYHTGDLKAGVTSSWQSLGENVGMGSNTDLIWNAFLNSPGHFQNLVNPAYTHVGVGVAYDARGIQWTTHRFLQSAGGGAPPPPPPPPAPAPAPRSARPAAPPAPAPAPRAAPAPAAPQASAAGDPAPPEAEEPAPAETPPDPGPPPPSDEALSRARRSALARWVRHVAAQAATGPG